MYLVKMLKNKKLERRLDWKARAIGIAVGNDVRRGMIIVDEGTNTIERFLG